MAGEMAVVSMRMENYLLFPVDINNKFTGKVRNSLGGYTVKRNAANAKA